jgi:hypothetical protein
MHERLPARQIEYNRQRSRRWKMRRWTLLLAIGLAACQESLPGAPAEAGVDLAAIDLGPRTDEPRPGDTRVDATLPCTPRPFVPPGPKTAWKHTATGLLVVTQGAANHRGQDVIVTPGSPQILIGKFAYGSFDKDLKGEEVEVFLQDAPPCGEWRSLGVAVTSEEGQYGTQFAKERTYIVGTNAGKEGTVAIESYGKHLATASAAPSASVTGPPSIGWW